MRLAKNFRFRKLPWTIKELGLPSYIPYISLYIIRSSTENQRYRKHKVLLRISVRAKWDNKSSYSNKKGPIGSITSSNKQYYVISVSHTKPIKLLGRRLNKDFQERYRNSHSFRNMTSRKITSFTVPDTVEPPKVASYRFRGNKSDEEKRRRG